MNNKKLEEFFEFLNKNSLNLPPWAKLSIKCFVEDIYVQGQKDMADKIKKDILRLF